MTFGQAVCRGLRFLGPSEPDARLDILPGLVVASDLCRIVALKVETPGVEKEVSVSSDKLRELRDLSTLARRTLRLEVEDGYLRGGYRVKRQWREVNVCLEDAPTSRRPEVALKIVAKAEDVAIDIGPLVAAFRQASSLSKYVLVRVNDGAVTIEVDPPEGWEGSLTWHHPSCGEGTGEIYIRASWVACAGAEFGGTWRIAGDALVCEDPVAVIMGALRPR